jgi:hypothetical protein
MADNNDLIAAIYDSILDLSGWDEVSNASSRTGRTHAKRIFEKTGTHRQAELIRRFFEIALPAPPGSV